MAVYPFLFFKLFAHSKILKSYLTALDATRSFLGSVTLSGLVHTYQAGLRKAFSAQTAHKYLRFFLFFLSRSWKKNPRTPHRSFFRSLVQLRLPRQRRQCGHFFPLRHRVGRRCLTFIRFLSQCRVQREVDLIEPRRFHRRTVRLGPDSI